MTLYDFIFTKKSPGKYYRHIIFWIAQYLFWTFWATAFFYSLTETLKFGLRFNGAFILHATYTYLIVYYFSPKYFETKKYVKFSFAILILSLFVYVVYVSYLLWIFDNFKESKDQQLMMTWYYTMNFIINGPPVVCAMFLTCKILKTYYIKMEEKKTLVEENTSAELQLLQAQVHPHFLFNTLNNIYSFALRKLPETGGLVLKLSDTLRYMIHECNAVLVPLEKELKMIEDYIALEKIRYGSRLKMEFIIKGDYRNKMITPLLLIPFVENSFKHGASKMLEHPWISLYIEIREATLLFELINSKQTITSNGKQGIGLKNVRKRLELLYPGQHTLEVQASDNTFRVYMEAPLVNASYKAEEQEVIEQLLTS